MRTIHRGQGFGVGNDQTARTHRRPSMHGANFPLFFWIQFSYSNKRHQTLGYERKQGVPCDRLAGGFGNRPKAEFEHVQTVLCARCNGRVCFSGHGSQRTDFFVYVYTPDCWGKSKPHSPCRVGPFPSKNTLHDGCAVDFHQPWR